MKQLYELAQQLLALAPDERDTKRMLDLYRDTFALSAICLIESDNSSTHLFGESGHDLAAWTRMGHTTAKDIDDLNCQISVRNLSVGGQVIGVLGLEGLVHQEHIADSLATLTTAILERTRSFHTAADAAAAAQAEYLRSTLLDALAHAVKTPLATILASIGGLRETGGLTCHHLEFVDAVESEAAQLGKLTTRLLRMANLQRADVQLHLQQVDISDLIADEISLKSQQFSDHKLSIVDEEGPSGKLFGVKADAELLRLALAQLIENACKYSQPGSKVEVSAEANEDSVAIRVRNSTCIPIEERSKIFERFYRGKQQRDSKSGTGLGLDIARRIATAHGGTLALEDTNEEASIFRMTLPASIREY